MVCLESAESVSEQTTEPKDDKLMDTVNDGYISLEGSDPDNSNTQDTGNNTVGSIAGDSDGPATVVRPVRSTVAGNSIADVSITDDKEVLSSESVDGHRQTQSLLARLVAQGNSLATTSPVAMGVTGSSSRILPAIHTLYDPTNINSILVIYHDDHRASITTPPRDSPTVLRYLPLCSYNGLTNPANGAALRTVVQEYQARIDEEVKDKQPVIHRCKWTNLPVELFHLILSNLSHDDAKSLRYTCRDFLFKADEKVFHTCVTHFNPKLYDPEDHFGPRMFQLRGHFMKRFGISIGVQADRLAYLPDKQLYETIPSYHGTYIWPLIDHPRYEDVFALEQVAETTGMKAGFSYLTDVRELGLSLDGGLGWMNGHDQSIRDQVFPRPLTVFGPSDKYLLPSNEFQRAADLWNAVQKSNAGWGCLHPLKETSFARKGLRDQEKPPRGLLPRHTEPSSWPWIDSTKTLPCIVENRKMSSSRFGIMYTTHDQCLKPCEHVGAMPLDPSRLNDKQIEYLLEMQWALHTFLDCYKLAVIYNSANFAKTSSLTISKISSSLLAELIDNSFWAALPGLKSLTVLVNPDWRTVEKDSAGTFMTHRCDPSQAVSLFYDFLQQGAIRKSASIEILKIGWAAGGEHATGMFARNSLLLPAPIIEREHAVALEPSVLRFLSVKKLTLVNCWITPTTIRALITTQKSLKSIVLDSVSMTAPPNHTPNLQSRQIYRKGSWAELLETFAPADAQNSVSVSPSLQDLEFVSCGYAMLNLISVFLNGSVLERDRHRYTTWFQCRYASLEANMLPRTDGLLGKIIQHIPRHEREALHRAWGLTCGGENGDGQGAEFDGLLPGGTGRFSGRVKRGMKVGVLTRRVL